GRPARPGRLHRAGCRGRNPDAAPADRLGRQRGHQPGRAGGHPPFAGRCLPGAHPIARFGRAGRGAGEAAGEALVMTGLALTLSQVRYVNKAFWRNPASAFFTFAFPLMFLVIFTSLLGHGTVAIGTRLVNTSTYYVASMASFAVISACYTNIAIGVTFQRDSGVLKRTNGTPLPSAAFLGARMLHA